jgi:flavodoxin
MKKVLIVHFSLTGKTEKMAQYVAEGIRFSGAEAVVKKLGDIKDVADLAGYDGYIFGSPTFSLDLPKPMKVFLSFMQNVNIEGKTGGSFGPYRHDSSYQHDSFAPAIIFDILQKQNKMEPFELGPFNLKEEVVETREGIKACQDYGRVFGEKLGG